MLIKKNKNITNWRALLTCLFLLTGWQIEGAARNYDEEAENAIAQSYFSPDMQYAIFLATRAAGVSFQVNVISGKMNNIPNTTAIINSVADNQTKLNALHAALEATDLAIFLTALRSGYQNTIFAPNLGTHVTRTAAQMISQTDVLMPATDQALLIALQRKKAAINNVISRLFGWKEYVWSWIPNIYTPNNLMGAVAPVPVRINNGLNFIYVNPWQAGTLKNIPDNLMTQIVKNYDYKQKINSQDIADLLFKQFFIAQQTDNPEMECCSFVDRNLTATNYVYDNFPNMTNMITRITAHINAHAANAGAGAARALAHRKLIAMRQAVQTAIYIANKNSKFYLGYIIPPRFLQLSDTTISILIGYDQQLSVLCKDDRYGAELGDKAQDAFFSNLTLIIAGVAVAVVVTDYTFGTGTSYNAATNPITTGKSLLGFMGSLVSSSASGVKNYILPSAEIKEANNIKKTIDIEQNEIARLEKELNKQKAAFSKIDDPDQLEKARTKILQTAQELNKQVNLLKTDIQKAKQNEVISSNPVLLKKHQASQPSQINTTLLKHELEAMTLQQKIAMTQQNLQTFDQVREDINPANLPAIEESIIKAKYENNQAVDQLIKIKTEELESATKQLTKKPTEELQNLIKENRQAINNLQEQKIAMSPVEEERIKTLYPTGLIANISKAIGDWGNQGAKAANDLMSQIRSSGPNKLGGSLQDTTNLPAASVSTKKPNSEYTKLNMGADALLEKLADNPASTAGGTAAAAASGWGLNKIRKAWQGSTPETATTPAAQHPTETTPSTQTPPTTNSGPTAETTKSPIKSVAELKSQHRTPTAVPASGPSTQAPSTASSAAQEKFYNKSYTPNSVIPEIKKMQTAKTSAVTATHPAPKPTMLKRAGGGLKGAAIGVATVGAGAALDYFARQQGFDADENPENQQAFNDANISDIPQADSAVAQTTAPASSWLSSKIWGAPVATQETQTEEDKILNRTTLEHGQEAFK